MTLSKAFVTWMALGLTAGCGLFDSSDSKTKQPVIPGAGAADTGPADTGPADTGPADTGPADTGSGDTGASQTCEGLPGPAMVKVPTPGGAKYCIDRTEVTQQQYAEFLAKATDKPGSEHADCAQSNDSYAPDLKPGSFEGEGFLCIEGKSYAPEATPNRPMVCVDWCDAVAYCKWAGKRLCGKVGGGRVALNPDGTLGGAADDANQSQWYSACSQGGQTLFPYGNDLDVTKCEGAFFSYDSSGTPLPKKDVATLDGCHGSSEPYASIYDLSGSVKEMTDECRWWPGSGLDCAIRGGSSWSETAAELGCKFQGSTGINYGENGKGFRCCKDLP